MLENYVYISRAKLDTFIPQILEDDFFRKEGQKIISELGFNFLAMKGKFRVEQLPINTTVALLRLAKKYIDKYHKPGDLDSGKDWINGELGMKYIRLGSNKKIFALIGKVHSTILLLVGSQAHTVIGNSPQSIDTRFSHFQVIEEELMEIWVKGYEENSEETYQVILSLSSNTKNINGDNVGDFEMACNIKQLYKEANRQTIRIKFLARRLYIGTDEHKAGELCAMYSPLYVVQE